MSINTQDRNIFYIWMVELKAKTEVLRKEATNKPIESLAKELNTLTARWGLHFAHAQRYGINLRDYSNLIEQSVENMNYVSDTLQKREANPNMYRFVYPILEAATKIDKALEGAGFKPILRPVLDVILGVVKTTVRAFAPPKQPYLLSSGSFENTNTLDLSVAQVVVQSSDMVQKQVEDGQQGMRIVIEFTAYKLKGVRCRTSAYFWYSSASKILDTNGKCVATDKQVAVGRDFVPEYDSQRFTEFVLFIPYDELHLASGRHECRFRVRTYKSSTNSTLSTSDDRNFKIKRQ